MVAAVLLLATAGTLIAVTIDEDRPSATAQPGTGGQAANAGYAAGQTLPAEPTTEPTVEDTFTAPADPEAGALVALEEQWRQDAGTVVFDGQYAAQIASKAPGISDPLQVAANGTHTFRASDIRAEHERLRADLGSTEHPIILLKSTDYGKRQLWQGQHLWVTFAVGDFPTEESVLAWCDTNFANLTETERANQCVARTLRPIQ